MRDRQRIEPPARSRPTAKAPTGQVAPVQALGQAIGNRALARLLAPQLAIARDLKGDHPVNEGTFTLDLETVHPAGARTG